MKPSPVDFSGLETALGAKLIPNGKATQALHETIVAYRANRRQGTRATKTKGTVSLSGTKPWNQKGTGRARAGYKSSPVWRKGGVVFGPQPRDFSKKAAKGVKRTALRKALGELAKAGRIHTVDAFADTKGKTKALATWMKENSLPASLLLVTKEISPELMLASRNMPKVSVLNAADVNAEHLIAHKSVVVAKDAMAILGKRLTPSEQ